MKIIVSEMLGDATVLIYNRHGEVIHQEGFYGKTTESYIRQIPVDPVEYSHSKAVVSGHIKFNVVV